MSATDRDRLMLHDLGVRLRALRLASGYPSAAAYARDLGLPASTVRRAEAGKLIRTDRLVFALGLALIDRGVSLDWLIRGKGRVPRALRPRLVKGGAPRMPERRTKP